MTNEAIQAILEHLCNEARNTAHATLGMLDVIRDLTPASSRNTTFAVGAANADQLLRSIDDVRDLLSSARPPSTPEEFDLSMQVGEIVEVLNLASGRRARHMTLEAPSGPLVIRQDRNAVEQVCTRVLNTAFKLAKTNEVRVEVAGRADGGGGRIAVSTRDVDLSACLNLWLNVNPDQMILEDPRDVPFIIAVMVAGKRLRALDGTAQLLRDAAGHCRIVLDIPPIPQSANDHEVADSHPEARPDTLNVLVAEDCDDSFALSELLLQDERVWRARDGREALRIVQKQRFDVVFMDIHMPDMDGYSAIRSIREWETQTANARTPIVILSSDDLDTQRRSAAQCGCSGFLRKPLGKRDLSNLLDQLKENRLVVA